jgi:hypothetical protein
VNFNDLYLLVLEASEPSVEPSTEDLDKVFSELLQKEKQAGAPVVAQTIIEQMIMIKEQLKKERELKNYQRLKLLMIQQIKQLKEALGDDPKLIAAYNNFLDSYVKNKAIQLQEAEGLKESLEEEIFNIRMLWIKIARNFGAFRSGERATYIGDFKDAIDHMFRDTRPAQRSSISGFIRFIQNMEQVLPGYDWINVATPKAELDQFLNFIADLITDFQAELESDKRNPYRAKEAENKSKILDALESNTENVARAIKQISSILNTVKSLMKKTELESLSSLNRVQ